MRLVLPAISVIVGAAIFAACDEPSGGNTCASVGGVPVDAQDNQTFFPSPVTITAPEKVCWQNLGTLTHTITADLVSDSIDITLPPNYTFSENFPQGKDFAYHCRFHSGMTGLVQSR